MENQEIEPQHSQQIQVYPMLVKRFQSMIIDQVFLIICMIVFGLAISNLYPDTSGSTRGILFLFLFFIYEPLCVATGCTVGNYLVGIRVRRRNNTEARINIFRSYLRFIFKMSLGIISFFTVTTSKEKRAIHDMVSGSVMIYSAKRS